jgi:uncharacterized protein YdeI (YjbR/CyaY-like superfamily)
VLPFALVHPQREYNLRIEDAKQSETRKRRIDKAIEQIRGKQKTG